MSVPIVLVAWMFVGALPARADELTVSIREGKKVVFEETVDAVDMIRGAFTRKGKIYTIEGVETVPDREFTLDILEVDGLEYDLLMGFRVEHGGQAAQVEQRRGDWTCTVVYDPQN